MLFSRRQLMTARAFAVLCFTALFSIGCAAQKTVPQIVAWSDPSDLLTWSVPPLDPKIAVVKNLTIKNAHHWFWLIESPTKAHTRYDQNKRVIETMLPKPKRGQEQ